ncbi:MAG: DNA helicase Rep [Gammaproteobacteria bacterium]|nr:DNA helicase Rep [Gammaproteobacteria bacterium]
MSSLNPRQRDAVHHVDGPLLVLAGAGSGKTRVITYKIAHLIQQQGISPKHISAVTFTNKTAREMRERVSNLLDSKASRGLRISTFHTLGLTILKREHKHLGYRKGFSIFDYQDCTQLLNELIRSQKLNIEADPVRWQISNWKNDLITPQGALFKAEDNQQTVAAHLYIEYQRALHAYNAFDLDDLISQPVYLLQDNDEVRERWQLQIRYLLVDEYQDTNSAQYELVRQLVGKLGLFTAVGDDDQSIYTWRGAQPENLNRLGEDFPRLKVIKLEQNYRSSGRILKCANQLISNNKHLFEKRLWSELGYGDPLKILACKDGDHEAERIVSEILHHRFAHNSKDGDYAILYRGNHQSRPFERVLREHSIAYHLSGGMSFFEYAEVKDLVAYLRLLVNDHDDRAFLRAVNTPRREIGMSTLEKLAIFAGEQGLSLLNAAQHPELKQHLSTRACLRVQSFSDWVHELSLRAQEKEPVSLIKELVKEINYESWITERSKDPDDAERRWKNVEDLLAWLKKAAKQGDTDKSLTDLINRLSLMDILDRNKDDEKNENCVHLMTLHAAKGLEFPHVFLSGFEEDLLPHRNSQEEEGIEEERRLAYVGITRAQKNLTISYAKKRKRAGEWQECEPSRFLEELPADDLEWEGKTSEKTPEQQQERGKAYLSNLRNMLDG